MSDWFTTDFAALAAAAISCLAIYAVVVLYTRLCGVRSFAKMSGFDFAMTIAVGSVLASTALSKSTPLPVGVTVLAVLFAMQWLIAKARRWWSSFSQVIDNEPILVMRDGEILSDNLDRAAMTTDDLWAKLREANAFEIDRVLMVIVETTGDVSVLHGEPGTKVDPRVLTGVRGTEDDDGS